MEEQYRTSSRERGKNVLEDEERKSTAESFMEQLNDPLIFILFVAAVISLFLREYGDTVIILAVVLLNAVVGMIQEGKAKRALDALKAMTSPHALIREDGEVKEIPAADLLPGDIVVLEAGCQVPADLELVEAVNLKIEESALTGESVPVSKDVAEHRYAYMSTNVTYGRGEGRVTAIGMDTEIGKIAGMLRGVGTQMTPLQKRLADLGKVLSTVSIFLCLLLFFIAVLQKRDIAEMLITAISLAVAAVPEGLPAIVTMVLALSVSRMVKVHTIVKRLPSVETLGCVSVVCSDKTGTLTQNKMTVKQIYMNHEVFAPERLDVKQQLHRYLMYDAILNNDSRTDDGKVIGDPTESALLEMVRKAGIDDDLFREEMSRLEELPFDSDRKLMSTEYKLHGVATLLTKGALDVLLERSCSIWDEAGVRSMTEADRNEIEQKNLEFSERGLRVLAFAFREMEKGETLTLEGERDYTFLGLVAMIDPPREESKAAVADAKRAGIRPVMITGDHKITATAIAKEIGIFGEGDIAMIGTELDEMTDKELDQLIEHIAVFARVSPENKIRIVEAWQRKGRIVSMTGDGVNDAPALKAADIGVAMGITGTEVSKDAASMILTDDNFATIIKAVANGRNVYKNIKNAILFLLSGNMAGIMAVLYTSIAALPVPFAPVHLLFINLLTDSLPALAIGMEPTENDMLAEKPRDPKAGILSGRFMALLLVQGGLIAACTMFSFYAGLSVSVTAASTMAFATLTLARLFHGFNCRSRHSVFKIGFARNWYSLGAFVLGAVLLGAVLFVPPLQRLFAVEPLSGEALGLVFLMAVLPTMCIQLFKIVMDGRQ